jgi:hypothetical protein
MLLRVFFVAVQVNRTGEDYGTASACAFLPLYTKKVAPGTAGLPAAAPD